MHSYIHVCVHPSTFGFVEDEHDERLHDDSLGVTQRGVASVDKDELEAALDDFESWIAHVRELLLDDSEPAVPTTPAPATA